MSVELNIATQFSQFPFGRYPDHGPDNGQRFRDELLAPALRENDEVTVDLTGARGLAPSFLEEAFGGLVRLGFTLAELRQRLHVVSKTDPSLVTEVFAYIEDEAARIGAPGH